MPSFASPKGNVRHSLLLWMPQQHHGS